MSDTTSTTPRPIVRRPREYPGSIINRALIRAEIGRATGRQTRSGR